MLESIEQAFITAVRDYALSLRASGESYGSGGAIATETLISTLLEAPRYYAGLLTIIGYRLCHGVDTDMITRAAWGLELFQASGQLLDRQPAERAASQSAQAAAIMILANLPAGPDDRLKALSIIGRSLLLRAQATASHADETAEDVTALQEQTIVHFQFVNPLHVGMVLAGAGCESTDAITPFAQYLGRYVAGDDSMRSLAERARTQGVTPVLNWDPSMVSVLDTLLATIRI
jgi:hypothetical protein